MIPVRVRSLLLLLLAVALVPIVAGRPGAAPDRAAAADQPAADAIGRADELSTIFEHVAEVIAPSVVMVQSVREVRMPTGPSAPSLRGSPFERFFFGDPGRSVPRLQQGQGSGVIVSADGLILTNAHVIDGADDLTVVLSDGGRYAAEVVGSDPRSDVAVLRIEAGDLVPARFGDSDDLRVGQWVLAAGNPFGLASTITAGIVSAKGRSRMGITDYEDFIQTDAAINPGNSGGPLVNLHGEVIGISSAIFSRSGGNMGIGFAIPVNLARSVMDDLVDEGRVIRGFLGILIQDLSPGMARSFDFDGTDGVLVSEVTAGGPADRAGLEPGDIIVSLDGRPVTAIDRFRLAVAEIDPGTEVELAVHRAGRRRTVTATIGELPAEGPLTARLDGGDRRDLGIAFETLDRNAARRLGLDEDLAGVVITAVDPLGPAQRAGLRPGDVITHVLDEPVTTADALRRALGDLDSAAGVRLTVQSGGARRFVFVEPGD